MRLSPQSRCTCPLCWGGPSLVSQCVTLVILAVGLELWPRGRRRGVAAHTVQSLLRGFPLLRQPHGLSIRMWRSQPQTLAILSLCTLGTVGHSAPPPSPRSLRTSLLCHPLPGTDSPLKPSALCLGCLESYLRPRYMAGCFPPSDFLNVLRRQTVHSGSVRLHAWSETTPGQSCIWGLSLDGPMGIRT